VLLSTNPNQDSSPLCRKAFKLTTALTDKATRKKADKRVVVNTFVRGRLRASLIDLMEDVAAVDEVETGSE
jgi:hypothetical protein